MPEMEIYVQLSLFDIDEGGSGTSQLTNGPVDHPTVPPDNAPETTDNGRSEIDERPEREVDGP